MSRRISEKAAEIRRYLRELAAIRPQSLDEYLSDLKAKAACERYMEKITEAAADLALLVIRERSLRLPENDKESFDVLAQAGIIPQELAHQLKEAKGMRNVIAHQYGRDTLLFRAVAEELPHDIRQFLQAVTA